MTTPNDSPPDMTDEDIFELNMFGELPKRDFKYEVPEDRYSRPCGGKCGFDDFCERMH
jgi:hypothetical protein